MSKITKDEVLHLGQLARIALSDEAAEKMRGEISDILAYVGVVQDIATNDDGGIKIGARHTVLREDEITVDAGEYTEALLEAAPERSGQHVKVKKILSND